MSPEVPVTDPPRPGPTSGSAPSAGEVAESSAGPPAGVRAMSIVRWVLVAVAAIIAAGSILSYVGVRPAGPGDGGGGPDAQLYYCPMHPSVVQDHPGECPICSMTLVPKQPSVRRPVTAPAAPAAGVPGLTGIDLTPERIQLMGMRTAVVERTKIGGELRTVGMVAANERGLAQVTVRFAGWLEKLLVAETGAQVKRGQVLATVYSPDVLKAEQELLVARGWSDPAANAGKISPEPEALAQGLGDSARRRLELLGIAPRDIDEVLRTGRVIDAVAIRAPADGYVIAKSAVVGLAVSPGTVLFEIADLSTVWVTADIYEADMSRVRVGQSARFELASLPGKAHVGKVKLVSPVVSPQNRTLTVRLELANRFDRSGPALRPGMYGTVSLDLPATTALTVPAEAVVDTGQARTLFVAKAGGHFEPRRVEVGARQRDRVEILTGVAEGETVVTTGNFLVDSESRLRSAIEGRASTDVAPPASSKDRR